jgi:hypothetical protein
MGGNHSRRKGGDAEREAKRLLIEAGIPCEKIPAMYVAGADLRVRIGDRDYLVEVKRRSNRFGFLYGSLVERDFLIARDDRKDFLFIAPLNVAIRLMQAWQGLQS